MQSGGNKPFKPRSFASPIVQFSQTTWLAFRNAMFALTNFSNSSRIRILSIWNPNHKREHEFESANHKPTSKHRTHSTSSLRKTFTVSGFFRVFLNLEREIFEAEQMSEEFSEQGDDFTSKPGVVEEPAARVLEEARSIFVGKLPVAATQREIEDFFSPCGTVT
jgi:hypothetical protein